jgi:hypothetical protein
MAAPTAVAVVEPLEADSVVEPSTDRNGEGQADVKILPAEEYEAMVAELRELRPLRSTLRALRGLVNGEALRGVN